MKKILAMILAMVMALSLAACGKTEQKDEKKDDAAAAKTFIMGIDAEYPPFSYIDENGEYTGFDVEVCKAACDLLGWDMQVFPVNWDQKLVQLGDMLIGLIRRSKGRDNKSLAAFAEAISKVISKFEF